MKTTTMTQTWSLPGGRTKGWWVLAGLVMILLVVVLVSVGSGAVQMAPLECLAILAKRVGLATGTPFTHQQEAVLWSIRLPRVILGMLVGAVLAVSGVALQGLYRNPLADPSLLGVSSGAALGATCALILGETFAFSVTQFPGNFFIPLTAFGGGLLTTITVYRLAQSNRVTNVATMLLAGIAINALAQAFTGLFTFLASDSQLRTITFWKLGSLGGVTWETIGLTTPFLLAPLWLLPRLAQELNALLLGESEAFHLGVSVESVKRRTIALVALGIGAAVAFTGLIGFVGLVVPHLLRLVLGPNHKTLFPAAALLGAALLLAADVVARTAVAPAELPIGIVTAFLGAPVFLWLLLRERKRQVF